MVSSSPGFLLHYTAFNYLWSLSNVFNAYCSLNAETWHYTYDYFHASSSFEKSEASSQVPYNSIKFGSLPCAMKRATSKTPLILLWQLRGEKNPLSFDEKRQLEVEKPQFLACKADYKKMDPFDWDLAISLLSRSKLLDVLGIIAQCEYDTIYSTSDLINAFHALHLLLAVGRQNQTYNYR